MPARSYIPIHVAVGATDVYRLEVLQRDHKLLAAHRQLRTDAVSPLRLMKTDFVLSVVRDVHRHVLQLDPVVAHEHHLREDAEAGRLGKDVREFAVVVVVGDAESDEAVVRAGAITQEASWQGPEHVKTCVGLLHVVPTSREVHGW